ncbi:protein DWD HYPERSENSITIVE TO UV-B 1 isoform X1 [Andrographis paniculata]|uniref:protein DWD HYPERSENSITIVE TO UV-B 1 isoform X1 n=1 Tax=Andrographis paniculata TaxID=175694 RepID=UPI0021E85808|nr:protein DWD HYPERSENSITIVE TO UV-B 1 isoform X1 [Andrographis paniculata]
MAIDIGTLEKRYFDGCKRQGIMPNKAIVAALFKAKIKKARHETCTLMVSMDDLRDVDFYPLLDLLKEIDVSEVDAVDMVNKSSCVLGGEYASSLLHAISKKLRVVDICDISFGKDFLLDLAQRGLSCQVLNLRSSHFRKLSMVGQFVRMQTLNLDFSTSLTSFREDCFSCMPNLRFLSLCETRITNLWTTSAALEKLPSLVELRFQKCLYCSDMDYSSASPGNEINEDMSSSYVELGLHVDLHSPSDEVFSHLQLDVDDEDMGNYDIVQDVRSSNEGSSDDSEVDFSGHRQDFEQLELAPDRTLGWNELTDMPNEISFGTLDMQHDDLFPHELVNLSPLTSTATKKYISRHASPICYEKHYRDYMIASLPNLKVLDNLPVEEVERERANDIFSQHFEYLPYNRRYKESVVSLLQQREIKSNLSCTPPSKKQFSTSRISQCFYSRSISAAIMGSSAWPILHPLSITSGVLREERRNFRPRQFEYHPSDSSLMVFGTLDGEVVIINHESGKIVRNIPSLGAMNSVLGLCWLKRYPSKLIAGSDNGSLRLYDIKHIPAEGGWLHHTPGSINFDEFDQLTSVHVNSTDELFLASGYSKNVALYDIGTGRRLHVFADMHQEHINVVKFSNHSPSMFATSSFDQDVKMWDIRQKPIQPCYTATSSRGNVMVCFSPDDHYLLVSAVDNEVKQLLAVDGRLHMDFGIASTGSSQNYTRSYYMSGRDYVISGSCDEHVVRICCANTGRRLRDVSLEGKGVGASMFVQSLRGDPFRNFSMSILANYVRPSSNSEIVKVNLLESKDHEKSHNYKQQHHSVTGMGG